MQTEGLNWGLPTEKVSPGVKRVAIISAGQQTPAAAVISAAQVAAAKAMGWEPSPIYDAALSTDKAAGFMRQAIAEGYDAIAWGALDPLAMKGPIDEAVSKGIALACTSCASPEYEDKVNIQSPDWASQGTLMANWLIASHNGSAKIVGMQDDSFPQVKIRMDQLASTLESDCPGCDYTKINFSSADLANPGPPSWAAVLAQYPQGRIDAAIAPHDAAAVPFYKTAQQQGRSEIQINSADMASEFANLMTAENKGVGSDVAGPLTIMGWAAMDQLARQLTGMPVWDATKFPVALVTYANVDKMNDGDLIPDDFDYQAAFKELWGKQ
ncbi:substrate-binding domain-containing protein [Rhodococcus qingshengii]|nr:substrate-binding domain-containing protein [Rhodococcus qingshengii]MCQ4150579.1 substrate-binding domain-containing protein [Rhodococcus qingshengii]